MPLNAGMQSPRSWASSGWTGFCFLPIKFPTSFHVTNLNGPSRRIPLDIRRGSHVPRTYCRRRQLSASLPRYEGGPDASASLPI